MKNNFEKTNYPYDINKLKSDLRSYSQKACDYINCLTKEAGAGNEKFVQNTLLIIRGFPYNHALIDKQVSIIEQRLRRRIEMEKGAQELPGKETFRNGVIDTGRIVGTDIDAKLRVDQFSGNMTIYGQYGMGKTNFNLYIIPQLISQGIHVDIFDLANDYRDILQLPDCRNGLVLNINEEKLNPLEPIDDPEEYLQFFWEITRQDFHLRDETKEMLFNYSNQLYRDFGVYKGNDPPTLMDLKEFLEEERIKKNTSNANKNKIRTALGKLNYILGSFKNMVTCKKGYSLDVLDEFSFVSHEIGSLSEDKRSWYIKLKLKQYYHRGLMGEKRHKVNRIIVVDEAKGIFGKSRIGMATNYIKDMYTKSRSIGCWWIISDQFATELADFTRLANCQICFQHNIPKEIREIGTGMGCRETRKAEIPRLGKFKALEKITDFPFDYPIMTQKSRVKRHIGNNELKNRMKDEFFRLNFNLKDMQGQKRARVITRTNSPVVKTQGIVKMKSENKKNPLEDLERFLKYIKNNSDAKLTAIYKALKFSGRRGDSIKNIAKENILIKEKAYYTGRKGRPIIELELTDKGKEYINEK